MTGEGSRRLPVEGCYNLRDLGGYETGDGRRVRWRRVLRGDAVHRLTDADAGLVLGEVGLRTVVDLRAPDEEGAAGPLDGRVRRLAHPVTDHLRGPEGERLAADPDFRLADLYTGIAEEAAGALAAALRAIADEPHPILFHCAAGKDRAGVVAAVLLALLGVDDEQIVADYALTEDYFAPIRERLLNDPAYAEVLGDLPPQTLQTPPEAMRELLAGLRERHGSVADYAAHIGLGTAVVGRLRERLLEPVPAGG